MKNTFIKRMSVWVALIMLFSLTVPVTGVLANGNGGAAADKEGYTMFKIEGSDLKDGSYTDGTLTVSTTFTTAENEPKSISWSSNIPVHFVYVKGGPTGIETPYEEGATEGSGLFAPDNKGISHVAFYYKTDDSGSGNETEEPGEGTEEPGEGTEEPGEGTEEPGDETEEPGEGTEEPGDETEEPGEGTEEPGDETEEPGEGTEEPGNDTEEPGDETEEPGDETEEPGEGTEEPGDGNEGEEDQPGSENGNKSTEIHLHLKNCAAPVESVFVELNGEWIEMSNPGNSPLYKLKDEGEFAKEDTTAFKLKFESGTERTYDMNEIRVGVEAEGSVNYWIDDCSLSEGENPEEPGDGTEEPGDDTEQPGDGTEEPGEGNEGDEDQPGSENGNKSTEIHLHLKNCAAPVESVFVELNGEWIEMSNPGNSPLYKLKDEGEFAKDDITAFKLKFESGTERTYDMNEIRAGVEAEGSVNYWLEDCALPEDENQEEPGDGTEEPGDNTEEPGEDEESPDVTEIVKELYITINKNVETVVKLTLLINDDENLEFINVNNLWKLFFTAGLNITDIDGIEIEFEDGTTTVIAINKLSIELTDQIIHLEIDDEVLGTNSEEEADEDQGTGKSDNNDSDAADKGDGNQSWNGGVLPKTGESSKMMFYIAGFLLMSAGTRLRMRKPIKD